MMCVISKLYRDTPCSAHLSVRYIKEIIPLSATSLRSLSWELP